MEMPARFKAGDGCQIAYHYLPSAGKPTLVLAHALGTSSALYAAQLAPFLEHFSVLLYDMRGHGSTDAPQGGYAMDRLGRDLIELLDHLELGHVHLLGVSLGAMVGQWAGYRCPERIDRLVLANTSAYMGPPSAWDMRIDHVHKHGMEPMVQPALERWFTPGFIELQPEAVAQVGKLIRTTAPQGYSGCCAAIRDMDLRPTASLIKAESLVICGRDDPANPPDHAQFLIDEIPYAQGCMLEAAHLSNIEVPDEFTSRALAFLTSQPE